MGGLLIATSAPIAFGKTIKIVLRLPSLHVDTNADVVVRWTEAGAIGVQFFALRAAEVRALHQLLR